MTAPITTGQPDDNAEPASQAAPPQDGTPEQDTAEQQTPDGERDEELPDWARKRLTRANAEAASYRTRLREAEARLDGAKPAEEYEQAVADIKTRNTELEQQLARERVARKYNLPDDLAGRLCGGSVEELEADAKALQKYATPVEPVILSGGLDPGDDSEAFDPVKEARKARAARR